MNEGTLERKFKEIAPKLVKELKKIGELKTKWQAFCEYKRKNPTQWQDSDQDKEMRVVAFRLVQVSYVLAFVLGSLAASCKHMTLENQSSQNLQLSPNFVSSEPEHYAYTTMEGWGQQTKFQVKVQPGQSEQEAINNFRQAEQQRYQSQAQNFQNCPMPESSVPAAIPRDYVQHGPQRSGVPLMPLGSKH